MDKKVAVVTGSSKGIDFFIFHTQNIHEYFQ